MPAHNKAFSSKLKLDQGGFTLVELLVYVGVLSLLLMALSNVFGIIVDTQLESRSIADVDQDGRYIIARLIYDTHQASTIITPSSPGSQSATLQISVNSINYTYSLNNGNLELTNNQGTDQLNSASTTVSGLSFTRIGNGDNTDTIRANFTVTSTTQRNAGPEVRTFQTTFGLH